MIEKERVGISIGFLHTNRQKRRRDFSHLPIHFHPGIADLDARHRGRKGGRKGGGSHKPRGKKTTDTESVERGGGTDCWSFKRANLEYIESPRGRQVFSLEDTEDVRVIGREGVLANLEKK